MKGHLRRLVLRVGYNIPTGVMPGPSWPGLWVTVPAWGPSKPLFCAREAVLAQRSSVPGGGGSVVGPGHHLSPACLEAPPGTVLGLRGWRRASHWWGCLYCHVQGLLLRLQIPSHQHVLHILIKVPPWLAGPLIDGAQPSCGWQWCETWHPTTRPCSPESVGSHPGGGPPRVPGGEASPQGCQLAGTGRDGQGGALGREQGSGRKWPRLIPTSQLAGGLWLSPILADTQLHGHSLSVSNYDKWRRGKVAGWQLPHRGRKQVFLALCLGPAPG